MKTKFLIHPATTVRCLILTVAFTAFDIAIPRLDFFKNAFDVSLFCKVYTVVVILCWCVTLFMRQIGFFSCVEVDKRGISTKWFNKTLCFISWDEMSDAIKKGPLAIEVKSNNGKLLSFSLHKKIQKTILYFCTNNEISDKIKSF